MDRTKKEVVVKKIKIIRFNNWYIQNFIQHLHSLFLNKNKVVTANFGKILILRNFKIFLCIQQCNIFRKYIGCTGGCWDCRPLGDRVRSGANIQPMWIFSKNIPHHIMGAFLFCKQKRNYL